MRGPAIIGVDTGGTFTDIVAHVDGELRTHKLLSTPHNPALAVLQGLRELLPGSLPFGLTYSTTVATNALLERKGARVVLLTTAGFEDLIEIGRQNRPQLYALEPWRAEPLVPRNLRIGVCERMLYDGTVHVELKPSSIRKAVERVRRLRPDAVAVCFLHSYANPNHERRLGKAVARLGDLFCSLSHELVAEYREYERLSTTVINAYVGPVMSRHLNELSAGLDGRRFRVLQSNGGAISAAVAGREAVRTCLSGPAGGVSGAWRVAQALKLDRTITFDMGGTSTDVSILEGGPRYNSEWTIDDLPLKVPSIDMHTVGAGGGSIAFVDAGGVMKVGPQSAGADPGPACYGKGRLPTVTDANVVLGRLAASSFLGGRIALDRDRALRALRQLGKRLRLSPEAAAEGVVRIVNASMERAIRRVSVERGYDPREYALIAFGGAAGQHCCELATALDVPQVVVPLHPGLLSAWGAATADVQRDHVKTVRLVDPAFGTLRRILQPMQELARAEILAEGVRRDRLRIISTADVRYQGQAHEINVPCDSRYASAFHSAHKRLYGYADKARRIEVVNVRVLAQGRTARPRMTQAQAATAQTPAHHRVRSGGHWKSARIWPRSSLVVGRLLRGPALIVEFSATTFVPEGWRARMHPAGHLVLVRGN
ncbi:MAG: hydantoinase/oxoprolinase family protein [Deltaproteobacteria bacterium]|nr:hydantoinase/oxoprolinase family protein [Deltaproteobacteria bacterium]